MQPMEDCFENRMAEPGMFQNGRGKLQYQNLSKGYQEIQMEGKTGGLRQDANQMMPIPVLWQLLGIYAGQH